MVKTLLILILLNKTLVSNTIITSFYIWFNTMLPSMFPMFILSDILITYNFTNYLPKKIINYLSKLFNLSNNAVFVFLLSMISGFPVNAIIIKNSYCCIIHILKLRTSYEGSNFTN